MTRSLLFFVQQPLTRSTVDDRQDRVHKCVDNKGEQRVSHVDEELLPALPSKVLSVISIRGRCRRSRLTGYTADTIPAINSQERRALVATRATCLVSADQAIVRGHTHPATLIHPVTQDKIGTHFGQDTGEVSGVRALGRFLRTR